MQSSQTMAQVVGQGRPVSGQIDASAVITLDVSDRPLEDVLDHIRNKVGVSIVTPPGTDGTVSIQLRGIPWRDSLELVAENAGCIVTEVSPRLFKVEKPPRITMSFTEVEVRQVIEAIAKAGNANIIVSERVTGLVTMVIMDRPWRDALDAVVKTNGFHVVEEDRGILRVVDDAGLSVHLERRLFQLSYLRPRSTYIANIETQYAVGEMPAPTSDPMVDFPLLSALQKMLSPNGDLDYFDTENAILVRDTKPVLDEVENFIKRLDIEPTQIYIDVTFLATETTDTGDYAFGFDRGIDISLSGAARASRFPFNLGPGSIASNLFPGRKSDNLNTFSATNDFGNASSLVVPGLLDFSATTLAIRLIRTDLQSELVQRPKLITLNHQPATIFVGETVRFAQAEATASQSGGLQLTIREADSSPVQTGFQLMVIPHVVPGTNKIMMTVIPEAETLTGTSDPNLPGFDLFEVGAGTTGEGSISLPRVGEQTVVTNMMLENGQTGVIGGLTQIENRIEEVKVPFLGDLPVLGWLFKNEITRDSESALIVFLTPWIIRGSDHVEGGVKRLLEEDRANAADEWDRMVNQVGS
jgi:type IV pilus assembly protein PilQ